MARMSATRDDDLTVDELARRAGIPTSTVRLYQARGLLPGPRREGRVGYYGAGHLARLRLIAELQQRGFSLAGIKQLVDAWEQGRGLDDLLGLEAEATAPLAAPEPVRLPLAELAGRFAGQEVTPAVLARAAELGLLRVEDGVVACDAQFLAFGTELAALGIPLDTILDESEALRRSTDAIAERFVRVFERHLWRPFAAAGMPPERVGELTAALGRLGPLAEGVVVASLRLALQDAAAAFVAEQARVLDQGGLPGQAQQG
jgi:DNA-binding transcriptional MerR regulator